MADNSKSNLKTFPSNRVEALALLYVEKHIDSNWDYKMIAEEYMKACEGIKEALKDSRNSWVF